MTIKEKIQYSNDTTTFSLFKEGLFYKCYNEDAMVFVQRVKEYKVSSKYVKSVGAEVLSLGFPVSEAEKGNLSLEVIKSAINASSYEKNTDCVVYYIPDNIKANYQKYKEALVNTKEHVFAEKQLDYDSSNSEKLVKMITDFDHYVKRELKMHYYGRYVDDMVFVHNDKDYLKSIIPKLSNFQLYNLASTQIK